MSEELEYEFEYEVEFERAKAAALLEQIAKGIKKGKIDLPLENGTLKLKVDENVELQIDAEVCMGATELNIGVRWGVEEEGIEEEEEEEEAAGEEEAESLDEDEDVRKKKKSAAEVFKVPAEDNEENEDELGPDFDTREL